MTKDKLTNDDSGQRQRSHQPNTTANLADLDPSLEPNELIRIGKLDHTQKHRKDRVADLRFLRCHIRISQLGNEQQKKVMAGRIVRLKPISRFFPNAKAI